ncbi:unnamed protein product [Effrenium voratum]|nr:unnamed protein product [Effrenium voratum]
MGLVGAGILELLHAEEHLETWLRLDGPKKAGLALAVVALVSQFVMIPAMNELVKARAAHGCGQPIHHPAPGELATEDDRMLFLHKLRAYENIVEWLPVFIIHAGAMVALGKPAICVLLCVPYTIGKLRFTFGYGAGDSDKRIPGLIWSDFLCLLQMRGFLIIALVQHFCF